jgi:putative ATP-dependent endonuclease of the OLD family
MCVADATGLKENDYKRYARRGLSECMLGRAVIIVEGATEFHALPVLARCLEAQDAALNPLDLAGVTIFDAESDGPIPKFAKFFQALGLKTFGFYDAKDRTVSEKAKFAAVLNVNEEHPYKGFEGMLATEIPAARLRAFLQDLLNSGVDAAHYKIPTTLPVDDAAIRKLVIQVLSSSKGAGWSAMLLEHCQPNELPKTAVDFLKKIYAHFPIPVVKPAAAPTHATAAHTAAQGASAMPAAAPAIAAPGATSPETP